MTVSHWRRTTSRGTIESDVVVIGGGIAGLSAALALQRRGLKICLVERSELASGASGRNAGFLMRGAADNYAAGYRLLGRETVRTLWRCTEENLADLRREGVTDLPEYRAMPSCLLALDEHERAELETSAELLRRDGFDVGWITSGDDAVWTRAHPKPLAGLLNPHDATCNPIELIHMIAGKITEPIHTGQEVAWIEGLRDRVEVCASDATFIADRVLICTNAFVSQLVPSLRGVIIPRRGQMLALRPREPIRLDHAYYARHGSEYFRQTPDGTIVVGGCRTNHADIEVGFEDIVTEPVQLDIERFARRILGVDYHVFARWAGTMGFSPDGMPLIGPVEGPWRTGTVWFCGGFTGHGMSLGFRCARAAVEAMLDGRPTPFTIDRLTR